MNRFCLLILSFVFLNSAFAESKWEQPSFRATKSSMQLPSQFDFEAAVEMSDYSFQINGRMGLKKARKRKAIYEGKTQVTEEQLGDLGYRTTKLILKRKKGKPWNHMYIQIVTSSFGFKLNELILKAPLSGFPGEGTKVTAELWYHRVGGPSFPVSYLLDQGLGAITAMSAL